MLFPEALRRPILGYCITICGEFMYVFSTRESIFSLRLSLPEKEYLSGLLYETIGYYVSRMNLKKDHLVPEVCLSMHSVEPAK